MGTIETIFENYKASHNEETPLSAEQETAMGELEQETLRDQTAFDKAIVLSRASEKAGFVLGFKIAVDLILESVAV